jgi:hypothetical protein
MNTNKIALRTVEEFMAGYTPTYKPLYPLFMGKAQKYSSEAGKIEFRRVDTIGDIRAKHVTPKSTEIEQIAVIEGKKAYKKYFLAKQFRQSDLQDREGIEDIIARVLDEHQVHMDELFLLGEGTSASTMLNNGLFWSNDANYTLESSTELAKADFNSALVTAVASSARKAKATAGQKVVIMYGSSVLPIYDSLFSTSQKPVKVALQEVLGPEFSLAEMPAAVTPTSANGWIVANLDQVKLHHTALPGLLAQGVNEEQMYSWHNFLMGSCMLEVLAKYGVIRQPATLQA